MFCKKCGNEISNDVAFCDKCGAAVIDNRQADVETPSQTQTKRIFDNKLKWIIVACVVSVVIAIITAATILSAPKYEFGRFPDIKTNPNYYTNVESDVTYNNETQKYSFEFRECFDMNGRGVSPDDKEAIELTQTTLSLEVDKKDLIKAAQDGAYTLKDGYTLRLVSDTQIQMVLYSIIYEVNNGGNVGYGIDRIVDESQVTETDESHKFAIITFEILEMS